MIDNQLA